jgi:tRNA-N(6)-(isopentenyl)adenosine-37 thiotransferase enzyme MiaB
MLYNKMITKDQIDEQYEYMRKICLTHNNKKVYAYIQTFGCQQNEADSERLTGMAKEMGYIICGEASEADLILINTCAIREHAELKALSITGQFKHLKAKKPELLIGICGCMVSQEHRKDDIKNKYPYVDFLFGTNMLYRFPEILYRTIVDNKRKFYIEDNDGNIAEGLPVVRESSFKAWVSVMYGCNNYCTYCVVPYVRGRERSRKPEDITAEINQLAAEGYKEITLLGQNVNSYGKDLQIEYDFSDLLNDICKIDGDFLIRFMTSHPKDATFKLIDTMAANDKIAKQLHLPLQAGSNRVLKKMNRVYTKEHYTELIDYTRKLMPDIALSTDIIVGFPTETDEDFAETIEMLERIRYDSIYSFIYSRRKGTVAYDMDGQIPDIIKSKRFERLLEVQNRISNEKNQMYDKQVIRVLCEGKSKSDDTKYTGRNEKNRLVHFEADDSYVGKFVDVLITKAETYALMGIINKHK